MKKRFTIKASADMTDDQAQMFVSLSQFAADDIAEIEKDYGKKLSPRGWGQVMDYTEEIILHPEWIEEHVGKGLDSMKAHLDAVICDIYEDDTGITGIYESDDIRCASSRKFSQAKATVPTDRADSFKKFLDSIGVDYTTEEVDNGIEFLYGIYVGSKESKRIEKYLDKITSSTIRGGKEMNKRKFVVKASRSDDAFYTTKFPSVKVGEVKVAPQRGNYTVFIGLSDGTIAYQWCESKVAAEREAKYARGEIKKYGPDDSYWTEQGYKVWNPKANATTSTKRRSAVMAAKGKTLATAPTEEELVRLINEYYYSKNYEIRDGRVYNSKLDKYMDDVAVEQKKGRWIFKRIEAATSTKRKFVVKAACGKKSVKSASRPVTQEYITEEFVENANDDYLTTAYENSNLTVILIEDSDLVILADGPNHGEIEKRAKEVAEKIYPQYGVIGDYKDLKSRGYSDAPVGSAVKCSTLDADYDGFKLFAYDVEGADVDTSSAATKDEIEDALDYLFSWDEVDTVDIYDGDPDFSDDAWVVTRDEYNTDLAGRLAEIFKGMDRERGIGAAKSVKCATDFEESGEEDHDFGSPAYKILRVLRDNMYQNHDGDTVGGIEIGVADIYTTVNNGFAFEINLYDPDDYMNDTFIKVVSTIDSYENDAFLYRVGNSGQYEQISRFGAAEQINTIINDVAYSIGAGDVESSTSIECARRDTTIDKEAVRELVLYITNDGDLYRQRVTPMIENLKRKVKKGTYDREKAVKLWQYLADEGVKKYGKEFGPGASVAWLNPAAREEIARELRDYYEEEVMWDQNHPVEASTYMIVPDSGTVPFDSEIIDILAYYGYSTLEDFAMANGIRDFVKAKQILLERYAEDTESGYPSSLWDGKSENEIYADLPEAGLIDDDIPYL